MNAHAECQATTNKVWCSNCQHTHIPTIPAFTWACRLCGFGAWHLETALGHTASLPWHEVYLEAHPTMPIQEVTS